MSTLAEIERAQAAVDRALAEYQAKEQELYLSDGKPKYVPSELQRQKVQLVTAFQTTIQAAQSVADRAMEAAQTAQQTLHADPTAYLSSSELEAANARAPFVKEDCESLPLGALVERLRTLQAGQDKAGKWLYARYAGKRVEAETQKARTENGRDPQLASWRFNLSRLVEELGAGLVPDRVKQEAKSAGELMTAAQNLQIHTSRKLAEVDGRAASARRRMLETAR